MENLEKKSIENISILRQLDLGFIPTSGIRMLRRLKKEGRGTELDYQLKVCAIEFVRLAVYCEFGRYIIN